MRKRVAGITVALGMVASAAVLPKVFGFGNIAPASEVKAPFELIVPDHAGSVSIHANSVSQSRTEGHRMKLVMQGDVNILLPGKVRLRIPREPVTMVKSSDGGESHLYLGTVREK